MKKKLYIIILMLAALVTPTCSYLDIDPELGITENEVFSTYKNFKLYFDYVFKNEADINVYNIHEGFPLYVDFNSLRFSLYSTTDAADAGRLLRAQQELKICNLGQQTCNYFSFSNAGTGGSAYRPIARAMFKIIRIANRTIENIDRLTNARPAEKADLLGQAYFTRGFAHFVLCRFYGGMPYIDESQKDNWDLERLSANETYRLAADDLYRSYELFKEAGKMRRDAVPGAAGHLSAADIDRPGGCAALAIRARALMYAASPLNNLNGAKDWEDAAEACALALNTALEWQYALLPKSNYTDNFFGKETTNELLWNYFHKAKGNQNTRSALLCYPQSWYSNASGTCPTQNFVDKYETIYGDPLNTPEDRAAAVAAGHYNEQNPYAGLDPRFETTILHDRSTTPYVDGYVNIYYDPKTGTYPATDISSVTGQFGIAWGTMDGSKGYSNTGYYQRKFWRGSRGDKDNSYPLVDPLVRLAEVYLNYAECVNEAYGPSGTAGNCSLTALDAVNTVRTRVGMPPVQDRFAGDQALLRDRIRNERDVELAFEGAHYYYDIRRWKTAPIVMSRPLMGMYIESCPVDAEHPVGRRYERRRIPDNRQCVWKDVMYWWPFPDEQADKLTVFKNNERWQ